jgi:predicted metallopeptidase
MGFREPYKGVIFKEKSTGMRFKIIQLFGNEEGEGLCVLDMQTNEIIGVCDDDNELDGLPVMVFEWVDYIEETEFTGYEAPWLRELAERIVEANDETIGYIDTEMIAFVVETQYGSGKLMGRTYNLKKHPMKAYTEKDYAIVIYEANTTQLNEKQMALLVYHELTHIPQPTKSMLTDHDVEDFAVIVDRFGSRWHENENLIDVSKECILTEEDKFKM